MSTRFPTTTLIGAWLLMAVTIAFAAGPPLEILNARNPRVQAVMAIQNEYSPVLLRLPGVVGTATGVNADGEVAIKVYVESAGLVGLPPFMSGVPVDIEVSGMFVARSETLSTTDYWPRPVPIGVSAGHPQITAGTIGCRVVDSDGNRYALSNNHVFANSNDAKLGDPILQPGPYDGGTINDTIGSLDAFVPLLYNGSVNRMDAAIAYVGTAGNYLVDVSTPTAGYGTPSSTIRPVDQLVVGVVINSNTGAPYSDTTATEVTKFGRTTGETFGWVDAMNWKGYVCYGYRGTRCVKRAYFEDQILIWNQNGDFSTGGDSGSLIVTVVGNNPVALLFAGSDIHTIASPIEPVLAAFSVTIDDGTTTGGTVNTPPTVSISSPADGAAFEAGATIAFLGTASDTEDGDLTDSLSWAWASNINGPIGSRGSFSTVLLSGTHTITASVTDSGELTSTDTVTITVNEGTAPEIKSMSASLSGSSSWVNRNFWRATVNITVSDATTKERLAGATVTGNWSPGGSVSAVTDSDGIASVNSDNFRSNVSQVTYTLTGVTLTGYELAPASANLSITIP